MTEAQLIALLNDYVAILRARLEQPNQGITNILNQIFGRLLTEEEANSYIRNIEYLYKEMANGFKEFTRVAVVNAYNSSGNLLLRSLPNLEQTRPWIPDTKTIGRLIRNMDSEFTVMTENGTEYIKSFITFSKQGRLTESQIDLAVAKGYLQSGMAKGAKAILNMDLQEIVTREVYDRVTNDSKFFRKIRFEEIEGMSIGEAAKARLRKEFEEKLKNEQYMPLINKNGKVMVFKVETYSDLVARTRLGEAQTAGTIDSGQSVGINYFRVSAHNTTTPQCAVHERKIYAVKKNDPKFPALSDYTPYKDNKGRIQQSQNKPLYHINCRHRLLPYVITKKQYEKLPDRK